MNTSRISETRLAPLAGKKLLPLLFSAMLSLLLITGAQVRADDPKIPGPTSFVRVLHAIPAGPKVDVYVDGNKMLDDYEFSGLSKYLRIPAGRHTFRILTNNPSRTLLAGSANFRNGDFYTVIAQGTPYRPRLTVANESTGTVPYGRARVTVYHLSPGTPRLDVLAYTASGGAYRLLRGVRYGQTRSVAAPAVPMTVKLRANGRIIKTITGAEPRAGRRYAAFVIGRIGGSGNQAFKVLLDVSASQ